MKLALIAFWMLVLAPVAHAFPDRPITLVMPYPATGSPDIDGISRITKLTKTIQAFSTPSLTDSLAQELAQLMAGALEQPVNIERQSAGNTITGTLNAARAKPDGYTLLFAGNPTITIYPSLYPRLPINPQKDLLPVAVFARMPMALVAAGDNPVKTVRQLIERARLMPGQINYAVTSDGSTAHLTGELFGAMSGVKMVHVNYNGSLPAINAVITGDVEVAFVPLPTALPFLKGGAINTIAITSSSRHPAIPSVPTVAESGLSGFEASGWFGVFAPSGTPGAIISLLNNVVNKTVSEDLLQRALTNHGLTVEPGTPEQFRALIEKDSQRWGRLLKAAINRH